ncbi:autotransporter outer membrane beta-barrel domain-containing protein [Fusobacterium ulcerans]|uniref:autotransporter family protein n=1 Tax=Fusobacterium ulcerans TaxID=861 RepID=UPI00241D1173|nr:autotransporter outer membrane beta-barrel domain-containing protein [Fusobacterium ulcerans]
MIEKIMRAVKSNNKKRGRNITVGAVVGMLLSCTVAMGTDNYLWIKKDSDGTIKFSKNSTDKDGTDGTWGENPYRENTWDGVKYEYVNNITLFGKDNGTDGTYNIGYGLKLSGDLGDLSFVNNGSITGTGSSSTGIQGNVTTLTNNGSITGISSGSSSYNLGYGIQGNVTTLTNNGSITGTSSESSSYNSGYGIQGNVTTLTNNGIITGTGSSSYKSGYGIRISSRNIRLTNTGVIYGDTNAIASSSSSIANNYGILVNGKDTSVVNGPTLNNFGLTIKNNGTNVVAGNPNSNPVKVIVGYIDERTPLKRSMTIKNKSDGSSFHGKDSNDNSILNAIGDTYKVTNISDPMDNAIKYSITGSIINAYKDAVVFTATDKQLTLSGTTVNGGISGDDTFAIKGSDGADKMILEGKNVAYEGSTTPKFQQTVINGNINMQDGNNSVTLKNGSVVNGSIITGTGDDTLTIENGSQINGAIEGGDGDDILNFGENVIAKSTSNNDEIRIQHNISNFENININSNVTFYETDVAVTGVNDLTIGKNGVLTLRIDGANGNSHALSSNTETGTIKSEEGGKFLLALNGAGLNTKISFGNLELDKSLVTGYEGKYQEDVTFETTSVLHSVKRTLEINEVEVEAKKNLPSIPSGFDDLFYEKLNKIYHSILSVEDLLGNFNVDDDEKLSTFLGYLNDIYAGSPYSYSSELSRKSAGMFRDIVTDNIFKADAGKWMIYGGLTHVDGGTKDTYYGKGYYTYDIGSSDMDAETKITGAYMLGEYGVSDTLTSGVVIGGNKLKSDLSNGSKVDGSALYLGAYAKKYVGNLKVTAGAGFQYGDYDADRMAVNKVASDLAESAMKYSDNYNDMTYDIYLNGRYSNPMGENFFLEPYATLSYTYIDQDGANEGNKILAIETDSKSFDYTVGKMGVDLKKVIPHEKGKSTLSAGVSYTRIFDGAEEEYITGRFKGGSDFDILVAHKNEHSIGLNAKYALELENGVLFDVKGTYSVERDSHNGSGKNRTKGEWIAGAGMGYKF